VAKRVRGSRSAHRPGGQGPSRAKRTSDSAALTPDDVTPASPDELVTDADYSEVDVDEVAVAALAAATTKKEPEPEPEQARVPRRGRRRARKQRSSDLAARVAAENVWVRDDLRRIGLVTVVLLIGLAVTWVLFGFLDVLSLY
jgi:hypothetical protein